MTPRIRVQPEPFDLGAEYTALATGPDIGGIACFIGRVRGENDLISLTLEHYEGMTQRALADLAAQAQSRWPLLAVTLIHRIGRLQVGEPIVLVLTASRHRHNALAATAFLIEQLKTGAPFWKSQQHSNGTSSWVEPLPTGQSTA